jgi:hypothetical protein
VFILGAERSGSTWMANILGAHPAVDLYMEPFVGRTRLFGAVPDRNAYLATAGPALVDAVRAGFARLPGAKHGLLHRPGRPALLARLDRALAQTHEALSRRAGRPLSHRVERYAALNLGALAVPFRAPAQPRTGPPVTVVKELRVNFKVALLAAAFSGARCVVVLRHPGAQIASVLRHFERGRLGELRRSLTALPDCLASCPRLAPYLPEGDPPDPRRDPAAALALWWVANYDVLIGDLAAHGLDHRVVLHEDLSADPAGVVPGLLDFCGLPPAPEVEDYLRASTTRGPASDSSVDTHRVSAAYAEGAVRDVDPALRDTIARVVRPERLMAGGAPGLGPHLARYFDPDGGALRTAVAAG